MAKTTKQLTDTEVKTAKAKDKEYNLADGKGLALRVKPTGTKTWILMSPYGLDWRWFLEDKKTIWYNNTRLFRQQTEGDWYKLMQRVSIELQKEFVI